MEQREMIASDRDTVLDKKRQERIDAQESRQTGMIAIAKARDNELKALWEKVSTKWEDSFKHIEEVLLLQTSNSQRPPSIQHTPSMRHPPSIPPSIQHTPSI